MENTIQDQLAHQQEMLRDLQAQLADATDEEKKKSLRLKMNVTNAKIAELQSKQSSEPVNEEAPEEVEELEIETPEEQLDEAYSHKEEIKKLSDHIKTLKGSVDKIEQACKKENWFDIIDKIEDTESLIDMLKFHYNNVYNASKNKTLTESVYEVSKDDIRWDDKIVLKTAKFYGIAVAPDHDHTNHFLFAGNQKDLYRFITEILRHSPVRGQNFKVLKESLPSNYSKSKYLKEVQDATKAIKDICNRIDNSAKRGDLYNIAGDFGAISAFAKRCEEGSKEIYSYEKKGTLTESVSKNQLQTGSILYFPELKTYWMVGGTVFNNQLKLYKCDKNGKLPKLLGEREVMAVTNNDLQKAQLVKTLSRDEIKQVNLNEEELTEGCMTKKFENMTNREIASYIFSHPHTKFAGKMKECDDKEIMKAIRAMKKTEEEAPVTNTSAVATAEAPSMFMKKKLNESVTSDITEILDDVEDVYGMKARKILNDAIYHNKWGMQPDYFLRCANKLTDKGYFGDFVLSIIENDEKEYRNLIKKC